MRTIIFTTKIEEECYQTIKENWFVGSRLHRVRIDNIDIDTSLQSLFNNVWVKEDNEYRICLPQCVNPQLPQKQKADYVLSLVLGISKYFDIRKDDLYIAFHSGDLFSLGDSRRKTGHVPITEIPCSPQILNEFRNYVLEENVFQFRHDCNRIANFLLDKEGDIVKLGEAMINFIKNETI